MTITLFLADDHTVVRDGLRAFLQLQPDFEVIGDAADGRETVRQVSRNCPDVVIMDITMPELNGIEATRQIRELCPATTVIILSIHATAEHIIRAFQAGAQGYLLKESAGVEVINAVRVVRSGQRYLSQKIINTVVNGFGLQRAGGPEDPLNLLSEREREVLQLVVEGKSSAEIADLLALSSKTVETYRSRLMQKLGISDLPALVRFAIQRGLTPLE
jgi:DNA-binding NarL/FixJ family response regulator